MKKLVQLKNKENENLDPINLNYETRLLKLENYLLEVKKYENAIVFKYADGTMEIDGYKDYTSINANISSGGLYTASDTAGLTFPENFADIPNVIHSASGILIWTLLGTGVITKNGISVIQFIRPTSLIGEYNYRFSYHATGKWK